MSKKNNIFFKKLESFKNDTALILENKKFVSYNELLLSSKRISSKLDQQKKLIFLLGENNLETIAAYIAFINKGHTVAFLDFKINKIFFRRLVLLYKPSYIFCGKNQSVNLNLYNSILKFKTFIL